jgi:hypothetical protein
MISNLSYFKVIIQKINKIFKQNYSKFSSFSIQYLIKITSQTLFQNEKYI